MKTPRPDKVIGRLSGRVREAEKRAEAAEQRTRDIARDRDAWKRRALLAENQLDSLGYNRGGGRS